MTFKITICVQISHQLSNEPSECTYTIHQNRLCTIPGEYVNGPPTQVYTYFVWIDDRKFIVYDNDISMGSRHFFSMCINIYMRATNNSVHRRPPLVGYSQGELPCSR